MKTAILITGELRTIEKTIDYIKNNIVDNLDCDVFCVYQPDKKGLEKDVSYYDELMRNKFGEKCKHTHLFNGNDWLFGLYRDDLLDNLKTRVADNWRNYLRNSGSMIEYYQLWLVYNDMVKYERINKVNYDYVMKIRTDMIWNDKMNLDWLIMENEELKRRVNLFVEKDNAISNEKLITWIMITLLSEKQMSNLLEGIVNEEFSEEGFCQYLNKNDVLVDRLLKLDKNSDEFITALKQFIMSDKFILTFRKNLIYFMARKNFSLIPTLGITYGHFGGINIIDPYWFNAECQFREICKERGLCIFDYNTNIDNESIYNYEYSSNLINNPDPRLLYAIIRK
jgi:hypothetical protein